MKLSDYAKQVGVTYKTAWQWWKAGQCRVERIRACVEHVMHRESEDA